MDDGQLEEESLKQLETQEVKIKIEKARFTNMYFTINLAFLVVMLLYPLWMPISGLMYMGLGLAATLWMVLYKIQCELFASLLNAANMTKQVDMAIMRSLVEQLKKQEVTDEESDGTNEVE